jgi:hypothetical protein
MLGDKVKFVSVFVLLDRSITRAFNGSEEKQYIHDSKDTNSVVNNVLNFSLKDGWWFMCSMTGMPLLMIRFRKLTISL